MNGGTMTKENKERNISMEAREVWYNDYYDDF